MKYEGTKIVYEVGDFVTLLFEKDEPVVKLTEAGKSSIYYKPYNKTSIGCAGTGSGIRPATQEEVNKATEEEKIMWGQYEVKFDYYFGCGEVGKAKNLEIGCVTISKELWDKTAKKAGWL